MIPGEFRRLVNPVPFGAEAQDALDRSDVAILRATRQRRGLLHLVHAVRWKRSNDFVSG